MAFLGLTLPDKSQIEDEEFEVWEENWEALQVFLALRTQWRLVASLSAVVYQGLDYTSLNSVMDLFTVENKKSCFMNVQLIEAGALTHLNKSK